MTVGGFPNVRLVRQPFSVGNGPHILQGVWQSCWSKHTGLLHCCLSYNSQNMWLYCLFDTLCSRMSLPKAFWRRNWKVCLLQEKVCPSVWGPGSTWLRRGCECWCNCIFLQQMANQPRMRWRRLESCCLIWTPRCSAGGSLLWECGVYSW